MSHGPQFEKLLQPGRIGSLDIKNRYVVPPIATNLGTPDGYVTDRMKAYYAERALGGFGLIIVEVTCVQHPVGNNIARELAIDDDRFLPGLRELATVIKDNGARAGIQLHHAGRCANMRFTNVQPVSSSPIPEPPGAWRSHLEGDIPRELSIAEIQDMVNRFALGATRAREAGFELIEIHGGSGCLIAQFLSQACNHRQDSYGGELKNRARFLLEIIAAVRQAIGRDFPISLRLNAREFGMEGSFTTAEAQQVARWAQEAGVDVIHQSAFMRGLSARTAPPMDQPDGSAVRLAAALKQAVTIPVIATGRMTPVIAEQALHEGRCDFIGVARGSLADPHIPNKVAMGQVQDIAPCIACLHCLDSVLQRDLDMACSVNGALGHEAEYRPGLAIRSKRVVVVGGGPAGMEAARVAAARGHKVTLFEKGKELGGQLPLAAVPPHKQRIMELKDYLERQVRKANIEITTGKEVAAKEIIDTKPDAVVVATGVKPFIPRIPGTDRSQVVAAEDVLSGQAKVGNKVVIIGGELVGCETAELLVEQGKQVTVARRGPQMAVKMNQSLSALLLARLSAKGVNLLTGVKYEEITEKGLTITNAQGERQTLEADTIVLAAGSVPQSELAKTLKGQVPEVYTVGDCAEPRTIADAIAEGLRVGYSL